MNIEFCQLPADDRVSVRGGAGADRDTLRGFLTRTNGQGPVWADQDLSRWLGFGPKDGFTHDGTMQEAIDRVRTIAGRQVHPAPEERVLPPAPEGMRSDYTRPGGLEDSEPGCQEIGFWHVRVRADGGHLALFRNDVCAEYVPCGAAHFGLSGKSNALIDMARAIERHRASDRQELGDFRARWARMGEWIKEAGG